MKENLQIKEKEVPPREERPTLQYRSKRMVIYLDKYPDLETAYEEREDDKQDSMLQVRWGRKYVERVDEEPELPEVAEEKEDKHD